jgi:hypothetical protein
VRDAARMIAADPGTADVEILGLADLRLSEEQVAGMIHDLDPILDPSGPERFARTRCLWRFLEWLHRPESDGERLRQLLESWERSRSEGDRAAIASWRRHERELAARLAGAVEALQLVQGALAIYDERIGRETNKLWRRALAWYRIAIPADEVRRLGRGWDSIDRLEEARDDSDRHAQHLRGRFEVDMERWGQLGGEWSRAWLGNLEDAARAYWTFRLPESQDVWSRSRATLIARLRSFFEVLRGAVASVRERMDDRIMVLPGATCDRLREYRALIPPVLTTGPVLGPAFEVEADSTLRRLATRGLGHSVAVRAEDHSRSPSAGTHRSSDPNATEFIMDSDAGNDGEFDLSDESPADRQEGG